MIKQLFLFISWSVDLKKWSNWIWPNSWWWYRVIIPFQNRFYNPWLEHDLYYSLWGTEKDRQEADESFLYWCAEASGNNIIAILFACFYYLSVAFFWHYFLSFFVNWQCSLIPQKLHDCRFGRNIPAFRALSKPSTKYSRVSTVYLLRSIISPVPDSRDIQ